MTFYQQAVFAQQVKLLLRGIRSRVQFFGKPGEADDELCQQHAQHGCLCGIIMLHFCAHHVQQLGHFIQFGVLQRYEHHWLGAKEQEANATYLRIMVDDAIELPVELHNNYILRLGKAERLIEHKRDDITAGERVLYFIDDDFLVVAFVEGDSVGVEARRLLVIVLRKRSLILYEA